MASKKTEKPQDYTSSAITVLEGLDPVRKRPGMYIGSTGVEGLHHLINEVLDNATDEALAGHAKNISIELLPKHAVRVTDDGRGIPVDIHKQYKVSALELVLTKLHAGGKFDQRTYKVSGGLHGVGVSVVNALSEHLTAEVHREGKVWEQEYERGVPIKKVRETGKTKRTGTTITFTPDPKIFADIRFSYSTIRDHLRQQAYLTPGVSYTLTDNRETPETTDPSYSFYFERGIAAYVEHLNSHKPPKQETIFFCSKDIDSTHVEIALQYTDDYQEQVLAFTNNIINPDGGTHLQGFRTALTRTINAYARSKGYLKEKDENVSGEDVREGLTTVLSIKIPNPQFEGQTKAKLGNPEVRAAVETVFAEQFAAFLEEHPRDAERIIEKNLLASRARLAARAARESVLRKSALDGLTLPGKLADCSSKDPKRSELFIVEGDSAGGCFSGDTKVALVDGRALSFLELIQEDQEGKQNYCYTIGHDGDVAVAPVLHPKKTKSDVEVLHITLDSGESVTCTPDHHFMLRDGTFKAAETLTSKDSLMPLYRQISRLGKRITIKGYELVHTPKSNRWIFTHLLADAYNIARRKYIKSVGDVVHHIDFKKRNNHPDNLVRLGKMEHLMHHTRNLDKTLHTDEYERLRKTTNDKNLLRFDTILERFFQGDPAQLEQAARQYNHKIITVEKLSRRMDVYDLEVPETHNFALETGIFVHNSSKQGRDRETQAILPLRGKILNVERARLDKMLANNEIKNLIIALGTNIGEQFDATKLRYHKVVLMSDADVDGAHIRTLLLTLFWRYFRQLILDGYIYIAQPPLYKLLWGQNVRYAYSDEQRDRAVEEIKKESKKENLTIVIQRFKGLGEMNPEQLWETTMNPATRTMKRVIVEDAEKAEELFNILMGADVAPRKHFITTHAKAVKNLDI